MKIKLDENLPLSLLSSLEALGHDIDTVPGEKLAGKNDGVIWTAAQTEKRFLITQDLDFSDIRKFQPGSHHGIMIVRLHEPSRMALAQRVESVFACENVDDWARCFIVVTDHKIRVRRPPPSVARERRSLYRARRIKNRP
jgi:predicted nuclease of predicted toxin-antitoxin system